MTNKEIYRKICEKEGSAIPLFQQYWWMETVCRGKSWDVLLAQSGGQMLGAMPYLMGSKLGMRFIIQPQLTQYTGPVVLHQQQSPEGIPDGHFRKVCSQLIEQLESLNVAYFCQHFSPAVTDWLPFYWAGYQQTTRYTYRLPDISDPNALFAAFHSTRRKRIERLEGTLRTRFDMSPSDFARYHVSYWSAKGQKDLLQEEFITQVCRSAIERGQGVIACLEDADGKVLSARFVVFDDQCAYSLMSAYNIERHVNGHSELLIWHLLQWLRDKTHSYDFEGSMDADIGHFYKSFGALMVPYFQIVRCGNPLVRWFHYMRPSANQGKHQVVQRSA